MVFALPVAGQSDVAKLQRKYCSQRRSLSLSVLLLLSTQARARPHAQTNPFQMESYANEVDVILRDTYVHGRAAVSKSV